MFFISLKPLSFSIKNTPKAKSYHKINYFHIKINKNRWKNRMQLQPPKIIHEYELREWERIHEYKLEICNINYGGDLRISFESH